LQGSDPRCSRVGLRDGATRPAPAEAPRIDHGVPVGEIRVERILRTHDDVGDVALEPTCRRCPVAETPTNMVTWFQLPAEDETRAWRFYDRVFGWTPEDAYLPPSEGAIRGEISRRTEDLTQARLVIRVDDLDGALAAVAEAGGSVVQERTDIPEIGMVFAVFQDTEGNLLNVVADLPR
jgi:hypothetical protein